MAGLIGTSAHHRPHSSISSILSLSLLQLFPLLGGVAPGRPRVNGCDLSLENRVHQTVTRQHVLLLELRGDDNRLEGLAASTYQQGNIRLALHHIAWQETPPKYKSQHPDPIASHPITKPSTKTKSTYQTYPPPPHTVPPTASSKSP